MTVGVWILGAQLWQHQAALNRIDDKSSLPVILIESWQHVQQRRYHRQKLVLIWSAVHFAEELIARRGLASHLHNIGGL
ncbi:cryptochrome/photolyase family protein [Microcoleus sp.]|uniref:cryptochrome/photolyase family protein n=1 Tax=Microcoleus sp. TaxID=44472 RepID=UPI00403EEFC6